MHPLASNGSCQMFQIGLILAGVSVFRNSKFPLITVNKTLDGPGKTRGFLLGCRLPCLAYDW